MPGHRGASLVFSLALAASWRVSRIWRLCWTVCPRLTLFATGIMFQRHWCLPRLLQSWSPDLNLYYVLGSIQAAV